MKYRLFDDDEETPPAERVYGDVRPGEGPMEADVVAALEVAPVTVEDMDDLIMAIDAGYNDADCGEEIRRVFLETDRVIVRQWLDRFHIPHE